MAQTTHTKLSNLFRNHPFVRNIVAGELLEIFLVAAVSAILVVRFFLKLTGYPQLGGAGLHVAHVLPGGLLMLVAIVLTLGFLNKEAKYTAAVIGGIGFGLFIDELGKFVTSDTNYFFQPTVTMIYVIFVLLFLLFRLIENRRVTDREYLVNALETTKEIALHDLEKSEQREALLFLKQVESSTPMVKALKELLQKMDTVPTGRPNLFTKVNNRLRRLYHRLIKQPWFTRLIVWFFIVGSLVSVAQATYDLVQHQSQLTFAQLGEFTFSVLSGGLVVAGVYFILRGSRLTAYRTFERSVLVSLLLTQLFVFYQQQFRALIGLSISLVVLTTLQYMIKQERRLPG